MHDIGSARGLIITADDFGLHPAVNEAVERAHREGVLTAASLMMGAPATTEAVVCARRLPTLRVGLHIVLADGAAVLSPAQIPSLVDADGRFSRRMAWNGVRFFFRPDLRRQLAEEIRAQFAAYVATGLPLDHVNAHKHFHLHPTILNLILRIGRDYGLRSMRLPAESGGSAFLRPWIRLAARQMNAAGVAHNDNVAGIQHSGRMDETAVLETLRQLPPGLTEMYFHPATVSGSAISESMRGYRHVDELTALTSPRVRAKVEQLGIRTGGFADFLESRRQAG